MQIPLADRPRNWRPTVLQAINILLHLHSRVERELLPDPTIPQQPPKHRADGPKANDGDGRNALADDAAEAAHEDDHGADLLHDDGGVGDEGPEFVGPEARIPLEGIEEGFAVCVVIWVCSR